jgi:hypothetical protein
VLAAVPSDPSRPSPYPRTAGDVPHEFRRLLAPDERDLKAAALLRHPDLLESIAELHRDTLLYLLDAEQADVPA